MRQEDFERLFTDHAEKLFGFLAYRTGDRVLAEDILADTFEAAYRNRRRFDPRKGSEVTWLYAIAVNRLRDVARRQAAEARATERIAASTVPGPHDDGLDSVADRDLVMRALATISDEEREAIALRFGGGLSLKQVAHVLGTPMTTVEGRVYRALRKLRAELGG